jgi:hypothetical protein
MVTYCVIAGAYAFGMEAAKEALVAMNPIALAVLIFYFNTRQPKENEPKP